MIVYADTSHILSFAVGEDDSNWPKACSIERRLEDQDWIWCPLHRLEVFSAMRALAAIGAVERRICEAALFRLERALARGDWQRRRFDSLEPSLTRAAELSAVHGWDKRYTALDTWHVAAALIYGAEKFITFDPRQAQLADLAGLQVVTD